MGANLDKKRILIFLGFAFGIAWTAALIIALTGGLTNSPQVFPGVTLALILLSTMYMWAPAIANILTRVITHEGWFNVWVRPYFKRSWRYWLIAWFLPPLLLTLGTALFYVLFPQFFTTAQIDALIGKGIANPWALVALQIGLGMLYGPLVNGPFTFGEEFGWRAYLLQKLMPLGGRTAMLLMGLIWGVWHWPVILMGYEYGFDYPGAPLAGPLMFILVTFFFGIFLGWVALRSRSVWPAVIGHGAINGMAGLGLIFMQGKPNMLLGPAGAGVIAIIGFIVVGLLLFFTPGAFEPAALPAPAAAPVGELLPTADPGETGEPR